jgi:hypothetical protein
VCEKLSIYALQDFKGTARYPTKGLAPEGTKHATCFT